MVKQAKIAFLKSSAFSFRIKKTFSNLLYLEIIKHEAIAFLQILPAFGSRR